MAGDDAAEIGTAREKAAGKGPGGEERRLGQVLGGGPPALLETLGIGNGRGQPGDEGLDAVVGRDGVEIDMGGQVEQGEAIGIVEIERG